MMLKQRDEIMIQLSIHWIMIQRPLQGCIVSAISSIGVTTTSPPAAWRVFSV
jgi:hypothetical protein